MIKSVRQKTIYVLHKNGADNHYIALKHLLQTENATLEFREFSILSKTFKSLLKLNFKALKKQLINLSFILQLVFTKNKKVVLGIAPFDSKLLQLKRLLKNHKTYYHTSWACWDGTFHPKTKKNTPRVKQAWKAFLEFQVEHIFAVTNAAKNQLLLNYKIKDTKISVVFHALHETFFKTNKTIAKKPLSFIYLGRMLPQKGIPELLNFFLKQENVSLTLVGDGPSIANLNLEKNTNIRHFSHIENKELLVSLIAEHEFLVLYSKKTTKWEELFGMVIIECMSQGTIPIATNHTGPKEIITGDVGYLCEEHEMINMLQERITLDRFDKKKSEKARIRAKSFHVAQISNNWRAILN